MKNRALLIAALLIGGATSAQAAESCREAKDMVRMVNAFYAADARRVDIIEPKVMMRFEGLNGHALPDQMLYRHDDENIYLDINEEGFLEGVEKLATAFKDGEMCRVVGGEIPEETDEDTTSVNIDFRFPYRRTDGQFSVDELVEGAKDGSKVMNGVAPGGLGFAVPGLKAIVLRPAQEGGKIPEFEFMRKGAPVSVPVSTYDRNRFIRLKDIRSSRADSLSITGDYSLVATFKFDPEKMAEAEAKRVSGATKE